MRNASRKVAVALALMVALSLLIAAALPLWLPWILAPLAAKLGIHYSTYERLGYGRFVLHDVTYTNREIHFTAKSVTGPLPTEWWRERHRSPAEAAMVQM